MKNASDNPIYAKVAYDIASKIACGILRENVKFSGRSLMSSEYSVSQETIRRALALLADLKIVDIQKNKGVVVRSKDLANLYIEKFKNQKDLIHMHNKLYQLIVKRDEINVEIKNIMDDIVDLSCRFTSSDPLRHYEFELMPESSMIKKSVREMQFWQLTGATIIAIRRQGNILLSPGPEATFSVKDIVVVVGDSCAIERVKSLFNPDKIV